MLPQYSAFNVAIFQSAPLLATLAMYATYTLALGHTLRPATAFAALAWVNVRFVVVVASHTRVPLPLACLIVLLRWFTLPCARV